MKITINHNGKNNTEILGGDAQIIYAKVEFILIKVDHKMYSKNYEVFVDILSDPFLSDADKIIVFHLVNRKLETMAFPPNGIKKPMEGTFDGS